jgi:hypothetical protein
MSQPEMANPFTDHPREVGESYGEHMANAGSYGFALIGAGLACLAHAVLPFVFVNTGSNSIRRLYGRLTKRADACNWERHPII